MSNQEMMRRSIDGRLAPLRQNRAATARPAGGWVRAIRSALGMSTTDLARRLGVTPVAVRKLEASERAGTARLDTLARAADAMGCDLVYAFIPRTSLEGIVQDQAKRIAAEQLRRVETTMALEDQRVEDAREHERLRDDRARSLATSPHLWRELD